MGVRDKSINQCDAHRFFRFSVVYEHQHLLNRQTDKHIQTHINTHKQTNTYKQTNRHKQTNTYKHVHSSYSTLYIIDMDIDKALSGAEVAAARDKEVARIMACNQHDHVAIFDIKPEDLGLGTLKKTFRAKSLLIHPDKTDNKEAPAAFDKLQRANKVLSESLEEPQDEGLRAEKQKLLDIYRHVADTHNADITETRKRVSEILEEETRQEQLEVQKKQRQEARMREEEDQKYAEIKLRRQAAANWENQRESRVANWRAFASKVDKKKKKKKKVLA